MSHFWRQICISKRSTKKWINELIHCICLSHIFRFLNIIYFPLTLSSEALRVRHCILTTQERDDFQKCGCRETAGVWWHWTSWAYGNAGANSVTNCKMTGSSRTGCSSHARTSGRPDAAGLARGLNFSRARRWFENTTYCLDTDAEVGGDSDCLLACVRYFSIIVFKSMLSFLN